MKFIYIDLLLFILISFKITYAQNSNNKEDFQLPKNWKYYKVGTFDIQVGFLGEPTFNYQSDELLALEQYSFRFGTENIKDVNFIYSVIVIKYKNKNEIDSTTFNNTFNDTNNKMLNNGTNRIISKEKVNFYGSTANKILAEVDFSGEKAIYTGLNLKSKNYIINMFVLSPFNNMDNQNINIFFNSLIIK